MSIKVNSVDGKILLIDRAGCRTEDNPRGLLLAKDELTGWVAAMNQYRGGRGTDRQRFLSIWSGSPIEVDRKSSGEDSLLIPHPFVSVVGGLPPSQVCKLNQGKDDQGDGFIERILFVRPDGVRSLRINSENPAVISKEAREAWEKAVRVLFSREFETETPGEEKGTPLYFTPEARRLFFDLHNLHADEIDAGDLSESLLAVWSKLRTHAARLALIVHLLKEAVVGTESDQVDADSVAKGWRLVKYLKTHLRRVHQEIHEGRDLRRLKDLVGWMKRHQKATFKNGDVLKGLSIYGNAEEVYKALRVLEQFGYVRERKSASVTTSSVGRPRGPIYEVNPKVIA